MKITKQYLRTIIMEELGRLDELSPSTTSALQNTNIANSNLTDPKDLEQYQQAIQLIAAVQDESDLRKQLASYKSNTKVWNALKTSNPVRLRNI